MTRHDVYKCDVCGNIISVVHAGAPALVCCGKPMLQLKENTVDASKEKHVPVVERSNNGLHVKVGSIAHPMEEKHYIQWIEVIAGERHCVRYLKPGEKPEAEFDITDKTIIVREYCNLHGLWKA